MFTNVQLEKLHLIDTLFDALEVSEIKDITEREDIVRKLKGKEASNFPLSNLVSQHQEMKSKILSLDAEVNSLKYDIQQLVKLMLKPYDYNSTSDAQSLKSKYNIY